MSKGSLMFYSGLSRSEVLGPAQPSTVRWDLEASEASVGLSSFIWLLQPWLMFIYIQFQLD